MPLDTFHAVLFHTDRFPPLLVEASTLAARGDGLPDEATLVPEAEAPMFYEEGRATWGDVVVLRDGDGVHYIRPRKPLASLAGAAVMVEEPGSGLWRRYRAQVLDREAIVLLVLATGWATYGRVSVRPDIDTVHLAIRTALPFEVVKSTLRALEAQGRVTQAPTGHDIGRWIYIPETPAIHRPRVERVVTTWTEKSHLLPEEKRGLDAALLAYVGVMGKSYDPNRRVCALWIDDIAGQVYAKVSGEDRLPAPVFLSYVLADLKRELAADLPPDAFSPPRY